MALISIESQVSDPHDLLKLTTEEVADVLFTFLVHLDHHEHYIYQLGNFNRSYLTSLASIGGRSFYPALLRSPLGSQVDEVLEGAWSWLEFQGFLVRQPGAPANFYVIPQSKRALGAKAVKSYNAGAVFPRALVGEPLTSITYSTFMRGQFDDAVALAFKELEIFVRKTAKLDQSRNVGASLMREAFAGPLRDTAATFVDGEEGYGHVFAGMFMMFRNPNTHHRTIDNAADAAAVIAFVAHLHRIVAARKRFVT